MWTALAGRRQNQNLSCTTTTPSTAWMSWTRWRTPSEEDGWINAHMLFKEHQQQKSPQESPPAAGRGAECRMHGGESGRGSRHKVGSSGGNHRSSSSRHGDGGSASPKKLQMEPNAGHLTRHRPMCGNCAIALRAAASGAVSTVSIGFVSTAPASDRSSSTCFVDQPNSDRLGGGGWVMGSCNEKHF